MRRRSAEARDTVAMQSSGTFTRDEIQEILLRMSARRAAGTMIVMVVGLADGSPGRGSAGPATRSTLTICGVEKLLSTPTSKLEIIFGKFFAVFGLSMLTGLLNLVSMIATLMFQLSQIKPAA